MTTSASPITLRAWRDLDDLVGMAEANRRLRAHVGLLDPIDLEAMRHRYTHLVNSDPAADVQIAERTGATVGYVRTEWHDLEDGDRLFDVTTVLAPDAWGTGAMDALLDWGEARCREVAAGLAADRRTWLGNGAFGGDAELEAALERRGYQIVRRGAEMLRPNLEHIMPMPVANGYTVRAPEESELRAVFDMTNLAFRDHWGESVAEDETFEDWVEDPRFRRDLVVCAWHGHEPVAAVMNVLVVAPDGSVRGLLDGVATHPDHRRRGLGRAVVTESLRVLRAAGATSAYLGVDQQNHLRAMDLYEACGFRQETSETSWRRLLAEAGAR
jgi:ribosomal protein S18 acetylase RimI-like enzyme